MSKEPASARRSMPARAEDEAVDSLFDVPAAVLCAFCGQADCVGCSADAGSSGVVAIVPWERPGSTWTRLWATANAATLGADGFFAALPDGSVPPAFRFALLAEIMAIGTIVALLVPAVAVALPTLAVEVATNPAYRTTALRWLLVGVPCLAAWMIGAHVTHGLAIEAGARRQGGRPQRRRAVRFGLYSCGWDLMTSPVGAAVVLFSKGVTSFRELGSLSVRLPSLAATAFLKGVYGFRDEDAARARRIATVATVFIVVTTAVAVLAIFVLAL